MVIGIPRSVPSLRLPRPSYLTDSLHSTGSAGLINTISMYNRGAIVAGILGTVTSVGWALQGLGQAFYYRQVRVHMLSTIRLNCRGADMEPPQPARALV